MPENPLDYARGTLSHEIYFLIGKLQKNFSSMRLFRFSLSPLAQSSKRKAFLSSERQPHTEEGPL